MPFGIPNNDPEPKVYHFVVTYDTGTGEFDLDYEAQHHFQNGPVYESKKGEWRRLYAHEWEEDKTDYNIAGDALFRELQWNLNKRM